MTKAPRYLLALLLIAGTARADLLTLADCLQKASHQNPDLKVAAYNEKIVEESVQTSRSGFLPQIDFQGGYTAQKDAQAFTIQGQAVPTQEPRYFFANLAVTQTIYDFGRTSARYQRSSILREATANDYAAKEQETFLQVVQAYYRILEADKLKNAATDESVQMADHLRVANALYTEGVVTRNDVLQAEVRKATSDQKVVAAENAVENAWLLLDYLIGVSPSFRADLEAGVEPEPPTGNVDESFDNRPEVKAARNMIEASELEVKESRGGFFPEIFARLAADYVENDLVREQTIHSATVGLKINIFDGLATTSRLRQSVKGRSQNEERLRQLKAGMAVEYRIALNDARVASENIKVFETSIKQGEENLRINQDRYQEHVGTATEVLDAQTLLTQTKTDYYRALFDYQVAIARIKRALGTL